MQFRQLFFLNIEIYQNNSGPIVNMHIKFILCYVISNMEYNYLNVGLFKAKFTKMRHARGHALYCNYQISNMTMHCYKMLQYYVSL